MLKPIKQRVSGFGTMMDGQVEELFNSTTDEYANDQSEVNVGKTHDYILPFLKKYNAKKVVDIGCGVGTMTDTIANEGYESYGVDLVTLSRYWEKLDLDRDRFFLADPYRFELPFENDSIDFVFTLGVIEHVGTSNGHSDRLPNYHEIRKDWLREVFRIVKPGGRMLIGGPNRNFPIDTAHGPDTRCSAFEQRLTDKVGATVHKTWGENFLWGYSDIHQYLEGLPYSMEGQSVEGLVHFSRVPGPFRKLAELYVKHLPKSLLATGFNPWMMALVEKHK